MQSTYKSTWLQISKESLEGGQTRKGRRRDAALTWEVPPLLEPDFVKQTDEDGIERSAPALLSVTQGLGSEGIVRSLHSLVAIQRQAFDGPAQQHLAAIVRQLLTAELVSVRCNSLTLMHERSCRFVEKVSQHMGTGMQNDICLRHHILPAVMVVLA